MSINRVVKIMEQKLYRFSELPYEIKVNVLYYKIKDIQKQIMLWELAEDILNEENALLKQFNKEIYTADGVYIGEI